ncbi:MAG: hypothetical protein WC657_03380 [Candidatus Paceibacterota bacterium]|jgi:hypothetical protein
MENELKSSEVKTKNITLGSIIGWIFGVVIGITGIINIFSNPLSGLLFILATVITLPPANKYLKEKMHISLSKGVKIVLVLILLGVAGSQVGEKAKTEAVQTVSQTTEKVEEVAELPKITAKQIVDDYKANEVSADAKYKGKEFEISGVVETIGKDIMDTPYIALESYEYAIIDKVQCMFSKGSEAELAAVSKEQKITLKGEISGKLGNILVKRCEIVD